GRGGMGVVYEAEQISLGRRVALKVLPFASTLDPKQLQRFKNEAQAAASLHHTNIVPVHATGCERGVHYYAMQFIECHTLAQLIAEMRDQEKGQDSEVRAGSMNARLATGVAGQKSSDSEPTGPYASVPGDHGNLGPEQSPLGARSSAPSTQPQGILSTERSTKDPAFFRAVANLGIQAAEALENAHQLGVIHRDIKPANLMVDARGNLWITDFGLAHCQGNCELTMSGDLLGTLRYMSPEQALGQRLVL